MSKRTFGILKLRDGLLPPKQTFFTPNTEFGQKIDPDIITFQVNHPTDDLDDFLYDHLDKPSFPIDWTVAAYGKGRQMRASPEDVRILAEAYSYGSNELLNLVENAIEEINNGKSMVVNPYFFPDDAEDDEDEEE